MRVVVGSYLLRSLPSLNLIHGQLTGRLLRRHLQLGGGMVKGVTGKLGEASALHCAQPHPIGPQIHLPPGTSV